MESDTARACAFCGAKENEPHLEYCKIGPGLKTYIHDNGRRCILFRGQWLHFDHEQPEPGPSEERDYDCRMDHHLHLVRRGSIITQDERASLLGMDFPTDLHPLHPLNLQRGDKKFHAQDIPQVSLEWNAMPSPEHRDQPERRITSKGVEVDYGDQGYNIPAATDMARRILGEHLPLAMEHFLSRNAEYGDDNDFNLGVAGQYVDISRKVQKLKRRWWDKHDVHPCSESDRVIVMELIGHLLMSLDMMEEHDASADRDQGQDG